MFFFVKINLNYLRLQYIVSYLKGTTYIKRSFFFLITISLTLTIQKLLGNDLKS